MMIDLGTAMDEDFVKSRVCGNQYNEQSVLEDWDIDYYTNYILRVVQLIGDGEYKSLVIKHFGR